MIMLDHKSSPLEILEKPGKTELKSQFIELRAKGWSYLKISKKLKVSKSTLANWSSELEAEISSLRAMELDALYDQYFLTKEGRIKLLGEQLRQIREELKERKLSKVSTEKLLDMELKIYLALKDEYREVRPLSDQEIQELEQ